ncbi:HPr family phosphocarrier protein [Thalassotalea atypica]|uniref:HPr family phosphocarrier protein n=1 Tax=Thalassotalea atypica TaxID=2054316 RepID=UPI002574051F|nr:HPr family phosphocarrier protein [Thalassotalea atypica]
MTQVKKEVTIANKLGLHARAATKLVQLSQNFSSKVHLELEGNNADATSIMALMLLAGAQGKKVTVIATGEDAQLACESICQLINEKFDEAE